MQPIKNDDYHYNNLENVYYIKLSERGRIQNCTYIRYNNKIFFLKKIEKLKLYTKINCSFLKYRNYD